MSVREIFRQSWRITTHSWKLWLLMVAVFLTFLPTLVLTGSISGVAVLLTQDLPGIQVDIIPALEDFSTLTWVWILCGALLLVVVSAASSWVFQAAAMRASVLAADGSHVSLRSALGLGQARFIHIIKLSVVFGFVLGILGLLPVLPDLFLRDSSIGSILRGVAQAGAMPANMLLGLLVLLLLMAVALEDVTPAKSILRAWKVFKKGWWGFLLVMAATAALSILPVILLAPLLILGIFVLMMETGWMIFLTAALFLVPLSLGVSLFSAVFTLVMYTLIYRSSALLLDESSILVIPQHR